MFQKIWLALVNAVAISLVSIVSILFVPLASAQTWERQCINGKCTWVLVQPANTTTVAATADATFLKPRATFSKTLLEVAEKSYKDGLQSAAEGKPLASNQISRLDMLRIRLVCRNAAKVSQLEAALSEQLVADGHVASINAIDWSGLKDLLLTLLPIIIELIKLL